MSYLTEKKRQNEEAAIKAALERRYKDAFDSAAQTAQICFGLAELTQGEVARAYLDEGNDWIDFMERFKSRLNESGANQQTSKRASKRQAEQDGDKSEKSVASQWLVKERPTTRFDDVAGLQEVKDAVYADVINAAKYASLYKTMKIEAGGGVLMYGPPGTGKTLVARAIAGELDAAFFCVSGSQMKSKYVGETEKNMRALFDEAAKFQRAVVFIDEIDHLLGRRGKEKVSAVSEFLQATDGFETRKNCLFLIGATNHPWMLDGAVFRRMKNLVYVGLPDADARKQILALQFKDVPGADLLSLDDLVERTDGLSGADIARVANGAKKRAIRRAIDNNQTSVALIQDDVNAALDATKSTVSSSMVKQYRDWEQQFYGKDVSSDDKFTADDDYDE